MTETVHLIDSGEIVVPDERHRKIFDRAKAKELVDSILEYGQKSPGICRFVDGKYVLVFGERRLRACRELKIPFKFLLETEIDPIRLKEIELIENTHREDLDFKDRAKAVEELHRMKQSQIGDAHAGSSDGHGVRDTASVIGVSKSTVQEEIEIAMFLEIPEVAKAPNRTEARKVIKRLKEEYQMSQALVKAREDAGVLADEVEGEETLPAMQKDMALKVATYSDMIHLGRMEDVLQNFEDGFFNVTIFDPPWAVDYDTVKELPGSKDSFEDSKEVILPKMQGWLDLIYKKMAQDSHLYLFFGIANYSIIYPMLEQAGFRTNGIPLIWFKQGAHVTRNPDIWPGRSYEPIAYARKGNKILIRKGAPDVIVTPAPTNSIKQSHPTAKHPDVMVELLKRSAMPGDKVLDPMCGSGMTGVAAETLRHTHQLKWTMIEEKESFWELSLTNVVKGYYTITQSDTMIVQGEKEDVIERFPYFLCYNCLKSGESKELKINPITGKQSSCPYCSAGVYMESKLIKSYKDVESKTPEWKTFWEKKPELQEEMLEWRDKK